MNEHYIDPVEWSILLDKITTELEGYKGGPPAQRIAQLKANFIEIIHQATRSHFRDEFHQYNVDVLCTPQTLALVERYFSLTDIVNLFGAGWLFALRKSQAVLYRYPKIQRLATVADQSCLVELKTEIAHAAQSYKDFIEKKAVLTKALTRAKSINPYDADIPVLTEQLEQLPVVTLGTTRVKIIQLILNRIKYGMDINALGENGLGLLHELMHMDLPDELFCAQERYLIEAQETAKLNPWSHAEYYRSLIDFLSSKYCFELDWSLRDLNGNTVLHHAVDCQKSKAIQDAFSRSGRCYIGAVNNEGHLAFVRKKLDFSERIQLVGELAIPGADFRWGLNNIFMKWEELDHDYFRGACFQQLRCQLINVFSSMERAMPAPSPYSLFDLSNPASEFLRVIPRLLDVGNWDLLTRYPKMLRAFFELDGTFSHAYSAFLRKLAQECIDRNIDTQGKAEKIQSRTSVNRICIDVTLLHIVCGDNDYETAVAFVKEGADVFAEDSKGRLPIEVINPIPGKEKERKRLKLFLEHRMGMTLDMYQRFVKVELHRHISPKEFSRLDQARQRCLIYTGDERGVANLLHIGIRFEHLLNWPLELVESLLLNHIALTHLIHAAQLSFFDLYNLDPRLDKPLLRSREWLDGDPLSKIAELKAFKARAFTLALSRKSENGSGDFFAFFRSAPRDVVCRVVAHASPNFLTVEEGHLFAHSMFAQSPKENQDARQSLIEQLQGFLESRTGNLAAIRLLRDALLKPTEENIEPVEIYRNYYEQCEDERFATLFKNALAILDEDKKLLITQRDHTHASTPSKRFIDRS